MQAEIKVECRNPIVLQSITPDIDRTGKFTAEINQTEDNIILKVQSKTIPGLLAGINGYLKLIQSSIEVDKIG